MGVVVAPEAPPPAATTSRGPWRRAVVVVLLLGVAASRLADLAAKPFHHDESLDAWFPWRITTGQGYEYDPAYHGPLRFFLTAPVYWLFGDTDFTARVLVATSGTAAVAVALALRRPLGTVAAATTALLVAVSPSFLYYSRFNREDILVAVLSLAFLLVAVRFIRAPARWHPVVAAALLAAHFGTKETAFITVLVTGSYLGAAFGVRWLAARRGRRRPSVDVVERLTEPGPDAWLWAASAFAVVFTLLFTVFLTNLGGLEDGLLEGLGYWWSQHPVRRGSQPWFFYLVLLAGYEWLTVGLAAIGAVLGLRRRDPVVGFVAWQAAGNLVVYSWAGEKFAWLVLHPLVPLVVLAGVGAQELWRRRSSALARGALVVAVLGVVPTAVAAFGAAYQRPADPRELLVSVQSSEDVLSARAEIERLAESGAATSIEIDSFGGSSWPWAWYLRDREVAYPDMSDPAFRPSADVVVVDDLNHEVVAPRLDGWTGRRFRLREWWLPDYGAMSARSWASWFLTREPWSETASFDQWLYVRDDLAPRG